ncbi:MAG: M23 family metallopeptidase [Prevotellaceae bacterium]|jgi:murein DD-endopeptidase MepM/ murein hydrolase activator NlpD|nr:M23 family metallopeptidase [Prevotellaceae bacterium]
MRKVYYIYNPQTQTYNRIYPTVRQRALSILRRLFTGMGLGAAFFLVLLVVFGSPSEKELRQENNRLSTQFQLLSHRLDYAIAVLQDIQQRDDNLYRVIFMADPIPSPIRQAGYGNTNRYEELQKMADSELVINTTQKMDLLYKQLYIQSRSFDDVVEMCKNHDEMLRCIPAIQPVSNKDLKRTASGYGIRIHPIYGTKVPHHGMDFAANTGTEVYATGDGTVVKMGWQTGFGNLVIIDHGFGYQTYYAHLRGFHTKLGKRVMRGELIGEVGSTGISTGPHLHYEVHVKGQPVNPINYYFMDLSADDYDRMIQLAANHGKMLD